MSDQQRIDGSQSGGGKKRRGFTDYRYLITYLNRLNEAVASGSLYRAHRWTAQNIIETRAKLQRKPEDSLSAAVIVAALQRGIVSQDEWENGLRYMRPQDVEWAGIIDRLFLRLVGRRPNRSSTETLNLDALAAWDCVKLNCTEEQLQYLANIEWKTEDRWVPFSFDEMNAEAPQTGGENQGYTKPTNPLLQLFWQLLGGDSGSHDSEDERYGGRYGYGVRMPKKQPTQSEPINPEQIDHNDQATIDRVAAELLADIDI